jgi:hypothetical protein
MGQTEELKDSKLKYNHTQYIILNANGLNTSLKRQRLPEKIKEQEPNICTRFKYEDKNRLKQGCNTNPKKDVMAIKQSLTDKDGHCTILKRVNSRKEAWLK